MKTKTITAYFNYFNITLPLEAVQACSHQGSCDADVKEWARKINLDIPPDKIRAELKEYGAWDSEELQDDTANKERIIWLAAGNIMDEIREARRNPNN